MKLEQRVSRRLHHWADGRFCEPVVVIESDDWGLQRKRCDHLVAHLGEPNEWAEESSETAEDLEALAAVLRRHNACLTANVVVANPDVDRIAGSGFTEYADVPLSDGLDTRLLRRYQDLIADGLLVPQYHARRHMSPHLWLRDLRDNEPGARMLFEYGAGPALAFRKGSGRRYHAEYVDWPGACEYPASEIQAFLEPGLRMFEQAFGMRSLSTIAPNYMFGGEAIKAWHAAGIRCIQGANYRLLPSAQGGESMHTCYMGQSWEPEMLMLARHVKFEPRPQRPNHGAEQAMAAAKSLLASHIPVIIDTHRLNYTGHFREYGLKSLDQLLQGLDALGVTYLSTVELASAIAGRGSYRSRVSGSVRNLTPLTQATQTLSRMILNRTTA